MTVTSLNTIAPDTIIALLACRVAYNDVDELDLVKILEHEVEKIKEHDLVAARDVENYHIILRIFKCFKKIQTN